MTERVPISSVRISQSGTDNDVDVLTLPANASINNNQVGGSAIQTAGAGRQEVGVRRVVADPVDGTGTAVPVKYAAVAATADGDNTVVAAVTGKKLRVVGYVLTSTGAGLIAIKGGTTTLATLRVGADGGGASYAGGFDAPAFETAAGTALVVNNPAGIDTYGHISYVEV